MIIKKGVVLKGLQPQMYWAAGVAAATCPLKRCVITSAVRPKAAKFSYHQEGNAIDLRVWGLTELSKDDWCDDLYSFLGARGFDIVPEKDHIHVEWDRKKGKPWQV